MPSIVAAFLFDAIEIQYYFPFGKKVLPLNSYLLPFTKLNTPLTNASG